MSALIHSRLYIFLRSCTVDGKVNEVFKVLVGAHKMRCGRLFQRRKC